MKSGTRIQLMLAAAAAEAALVTAVAVALPAVAASTNTNPGFESGVGQSPTGWSESGTTSASKSEAGGRSGSAQLAHWASSAYSVETYQVLTGQGGTKGGAVTKTVEND